MKSNSIPEGRKEICVAGDGNCFYRSISLWMNGNTDEGHEKLRAMVNNVVELCPTAFEPFLFESENVEVHLRKSKVVGTWAETLDIMACATLLRRKIFLYSLSTGKWLKFKPLFRHDINEKVPFPSSVARLNCTCSVTLSYNDWHPLSNHFNLLVPTGPCCESPEPKNHPETTTMYLDMDGYSRDPTIIGNDHVSKEYVCMYENKTSPSAKSSHHDTKNNRHTKNSRATNKSSPKRQCKQNINIVAEKLGTKHKTTSKLQETKVTQNQAYFETDVGSDCSISKPTETPSIQKQTSMVNRTTCLKSNVKHSDNMDKTEMVTQKHTKQGEANKISNKKSFSHKKAQTDLESGCCTSKQAEKQSDCLIANDVSDFDNMNVKQLKMYVQQRGVPASSYNRAQLIILAKAVCEMDLQLDPNFDNDNLTPHLERRTTLPNGTKVPDPFQMTELTNDLSSLPPFGLLDIFNHLIMSRTDYDKEALSSWRSFDEYSLFLDGYVRSLKQKRIDDAGETFHVVVAEVFPAQKDKTPEGKRCYRLWFILDKMGSIYSAFCQCKGGADQGCRHLGAALFSLEDFLSGNRLLVTSVPAYWDPQPAPTQDPVPIFDLKISHSTGSRKRKITSYDESWIDSFDPRPPKNRTDPTFLDKMDFATKLQQIDPDAAILNYLPPVKMSKIKIERSLSKLSILSKLKRFVAENRKKIATNVFALAKEFVEKLSYTPQERSEISKVTAAKHESSNWYTIRHLLITSKKIKSLCTKQNTVEKNPQTDVTLTIKNFVCEQQKQSSETLPKPMQHGIENESKARECYIKCYKRRHTNMHFIEPGLLISNSIPFIGATPDGIRNCNCCKSTLVEFKCPYTGKDLDAKSAFLLHSIGGKVNDNGTYHLNKNHLHYYQVQTAMAVTGLSVCDFVTYTNKGTHVVQIHFDQEFWNNISAKASLFYIERIIPYMFVELVK